jgi:hypothetical protein
MAVTEIDAGDFFIMDEIITTNPFGLNVTDTITYSETARTHLIVLLVKNKLEFQDDVGYDTTIKFISSSDYFEVWDTGAVGDSLFVVEIFFCWEEAKVVETGDDTDDLNFSDSATIVVSKGALDTIEYTDVASAVSFRTRTGTDSFTMTDYVGVYKDDDKYLTLISIPTLTGPNAPEM